MPNVVSAIDGTSHEIQIPSNEPQQQFDSAWPQKIPLYPYPGKKNIIVNIIMKTSKGPTLGLWFLLAVKKKSILMCENLASEYFFLAFFLQK